MAKSYTCPGPGCGKGYPTEAARAACWNSHCTHPESHDVQNTPHRGQQSKEGQE